MEFRHLRFFIAVAEELSFTGAAERLRVAQPHISREIRRMEEELNVPLFLRDRRRVTLTPAGSSFLAYARQLLASTEEAVRAAQRANRGETGRIRVGFCSSAGFGLLPDAVRQFRRARPDVEVVLIEFNSDEQPDLLRGSLLDACFLYPPSHPEQGLQTETLLFDQLVAAMPEGHPLAKQSEIAIEQLAEECWIFFPRSIASRLHDEILRSCQEKGFVPRVVQQAFELATIASLVASGLGISLVPVTVARLQLPRMVWRPLEAPAPRVPLAVMWRRNDCNPALAAFIDTARTEAERRT